ncbi:hypothetical protein ACQR16_20550 [Bradyrhizobium oligotrophicum]|uniref:hypothetical protein n=1 Tax=Bradyrhizobium oligotrophicum TaxID=44255 RepID=UPI003EBB8845
MLAEGSPTRAVAEEPGAPEPASSAQALPGSNGFASPTADPAQAPAAAAVARSANPLWDVPLTALSATRDRPIFSASRRPPAVAAPVAVMQLPPPPPPPEPERPSLQLVGTVIGDEESFGIFVDPASQKPLRLRVGASYEGWLLHSLKPREAMLQKNLETVNVMMPQLGSIAGSEAGTASIPTGGRDRGARRAR